MATETATVVTESQPVVVHPEQMTEKQRDRWLLDGTHPEIKPKAAESAPAKASEKPASEKPAASQAAEEQKKPKGEDRKVELSVEIRELLERRGVLKEEDFWKEFQDFRESRKKADSQPAAEAVKEPPPPERPKRPRRVDFATDALFEEALDKHEGELLEYPAKKAAYDQAKAQAAEDQAKLESRLRDGMSRVNEKYPDAKDVSKTVFEALWKNRDAMPHVTWFLNSSEVLPDMLYALGGQFELDKLLEMGKKDPAKAIRVLSGMENSILAELEKAAKPKEEEAPAPRETKKVTQAPEPPREVGGKASVTEDPLKAAVARRNFSAFAEEANRRDIQRRSRGK
jgi:hypothetical protein